MNEGQCTVATIKKSIFSAVYTSHHEYCYCTNADKPFSYGKCTWHND